MSVICSDSEDSTDEKQVAIRYTAYLLGGTAPTPCFLPSSPKAPITPPKFCRFAPTPSTPTRRHHLEKSKPSKYTSNEDGDKSIELMASKTDQHGAAEVLSRQWHDPHDGQSAADSKSIPEVCVNSKAQFSFFISSRRAITNDYPSVNKINVSNNSNVQNDTIALIDEPPEVMKGNMREPSPSQESQFRTIHTITSSPPNTPKRTQHHGTVTSPSLSQKSPRKRRKKAKNLLPPYGRLMRDIPDDDIETYSSDEADVIRSKSSLMLQNLRQAHLEHQWSKVEEIEKWRKDANGEL
ncbi:hypothetical protein K450DRAFT_235746 [Umbelopsis ramanniana AG]|uniref:Uncharacterized protein n=1 Tax=Umbelopsis ramanniana AG TaxID=1314678 RepID=A0AAD5HFJ1_UMBRA|nr:uncharacterized protein K450DRAFT_235746 [Umbelopsis ramanniana AG]KAI8580741.1 hypothetical protein K450DRAFT_235746 [Umbelopsis ramanniana AG]